MPDPWAVLGLAPGATPAEARAARRRLAKQLHPDLHEGRSAEERAELARRMTAVNQALAELLGLVGADPGATAADPPSGAGAAAAAAGPAPAGPEPAGPEPAGPGRWGPDHVHPAAGPLDADTLAVEALPAEAFEALFLVAYGLGEILVADEPYLMELYLAEPAPCFCRVTLVPVAGGSIVTLDVESAEDAEPPPVEAVRDLLVSELNVLAGATPP